jgi:hypothetical protein
VSPLDFGYWVRGLAGVAGMPTVDVGAATLKKAREILKEAPAAVAPPTMRALKVPLFCLHNIAMAETCPSCGAAGTRMVGFALPSGMKHVYIAGLPDKETPNG